LRGDIAEGSIVVVAVKMVGWAFAVGKALERGSIHEEDVGSTLVQVVGVADGRILNHWIRAFSFIQRAASRKAA
jgi:hypothetical protein